MYRIIVLSTPYRKCRSRIRGTFGTLPARPGSHGQADLEAGGLHEVPSTPREVITLRLEVKNAHAGFQQ